MLIHKLKFFFSRFLKSFEFGFYFYGSRFFDIPNKVKINYKYLDIKFINEHGTKITFVEIFLDDVYKLDWIKKISNKNKFQIKSIIDIGANCGFTSLAARSYFPHSTIHSYEPNYEIIDILKHNSIVGNFDYFDEAIGGENKKVKLELKKGNSVLANILPEKEGTVRQITIQDAIKKIKSDTIDIVKMDCEGSEWEILENIDVWKKVKFITMEYHLGYNNFDHNRIKKVMERIGFVIITKLKEEEKKFNYGIVVAYNPIHVAL